MDIRLTNNKHNVTITNIEHITNIDIYDDDIVIEYGKSCSFEIDAYVFDFNDIVNQLTAHMNILTEELIDNLILMDEFDEADLDYTDADIIAITGDIPSCISDELNKHGIFEWEVVNVCCIDDNTIAIKNINYNIESWDFSMYNDYTEYVLTHKYNDFTETLLMYHFADFNINVIINREIKGNK